VENVLLSPGERIEILYDFSAYSVGETVNLESQYFSSFGGQGSQMNLLRFDIIGSQLSGGSVPQNMPLINYYDFNSVQKTRTFTLSQGMMMGSGMHRINGLTYEMNRVDENIPFDALEEWKFVNTTINFHPMHIHGVMFQVYARNGNTNIPPNDKGWKDTVLVNPNETVKVLIKFTDYSGRYLLHCHNLEHEDDGMMLNIEIDQPTNVEEKNTLPETFELYQNYPNPFNPNTNIRFSLPKEEKVRLEVYDMRGRLVKSLVDSDYMNAGTYEFKWDGKNNRGESVTSGVYITRLTTGSFMNSIKMNLIK
ncbi:MAG: multicopper oxidase domain-containing protein, partial [Ignavibacteriae bacterium]|nr:multicopper oxidase domain-containing protein [Ignavibacteriota bacterium]